MACFFYRLLVVRVVEDLLVGGEDGDSPPADLRQCMLGAMLFLQKPGPCVFDITCQFISVLMVLGQDACLSSLGLPYGQNKQNVGKQSAPWP